MSLVEMLVIIAVLMILLAMLMPALSKARESADNAICVNNLRQLGAGLLLYAGDFGGHLPWWSDTSQGAGANARFWTFHVGSYVGVKMLPGLPLPSGETVFKCPSHVTTISGSPPTLSYGAVQESYVYSGTLRHFMGQYPDYPSMQLAQFTTPGRTAILGENDNILEFQPAVGLGSTPYNPIYWVFHHKTRMNLLFADGHVGGVTWEEFDEQRRPPHPLFYDPNR